MFFQYLCGFYNTGDSVKYFLPFPPIFMQQGKFKVLSSSQDVNVIHFLAETFIFSPGKLRLGGINVETGVHRLELETNLQRSFKIMDPQCGLMPVKHVGPLKVRCELYHRRRHRAAARQLQPDGRREGGLQGVRPQRL